MNKFEYNSTFGPCARVETVLSFPEPGRYDITVFDDYGHYGRISVSVQAEHVTRDN